MLNLAILIPILVNYESEKQHGLIIGVLYFIIFKLYQVISNIKYKLKYNLVKRIRIIFVRNKNLHHVS